MTDEQLEKTARQYCTNLGLDPDADIVGYDGRAQKTSTPRWKAELYEVRKHLALQTALEQVLSETRVGGQQ